MSDDEEVHKYVNAEPPPAAAAASSTPASASARARKSTPNKPLCAIPGCTKQSQGRANDYMCRKHYVGSQGGAAAGRARGASAPVVGHHQEDVEEEEEEETSSEEDSDIDEGRNVKAAPKRAMPSLNKNRAACAVPGCPKQSQGRANAHMCRRHFVEYQEDRGGIAVPPLGPAPAATASGRATGTTSTGRPACAVPGCPKQSQGRASGYMCRTHFVESGGVTGRPASASRAAATGRQKKKRASKPAGRGTTNKQGPIRASTNKHSCAVPGCPKQSQGARNDYMCRKHFVESQRGVGGTARGHTYVHPGAEAVLPEDPDLAELVQREVERIKRKKGGAKSPSSPKRARASSTEGSYAQRQHARQTVQNLEAQLQDAKVAEEELEKALDGNAECVVCREAAKSVSLFPCGHLALCGSCETIDNKCPICLEDIEEERSVGAAYRV